MLLLSFLMNASFAVLQGAPLKELLLSESNDVRKELWAVRICLCQSIYQSLKQTSTHCVKQTQTGWTPFLALECLSVEGQTWNFVNLKCVLIQIIQI